MLRHGVKIMRDRNPLFVCCKGQHIRVGNSIESRSLRTAEIQ
jgi:hypothetical protein